MLLYCAFFIFYRIHRARQIANTIKKFNGVVSLGNKAYPISPPARTKDFYQPRIVISVNPTVLFQPFRQAACLKSSLVQFSEINPLHDARSFTA